MAAQHSQESEPTNHPAGLVDPFVDGSCTDPAPVDASAAAPGPRAITERPPRYLTVAEVAALLRVSTMTVYRQIQAGELPAVRVGKSYRLRADDVDEWIAECVVPQPAD